MNIHPNLAELLKKFSPSIYNRLSRAINEKYDCLAAYYAGEKVTFSVISPRSKVGTLYDPWDGTIACRQTVKLAAFIRKILPDVTEDVARTLFEQVTAQYIANNTFDYEVMEGEKLRWAYWHQNYTPVGGGNLRSCMSHTEQQRNLDFYVYNPETIKVIVALQAKYVVGRALIYYGTNSLADAEARQNLQPILGKLYGNTQDVRTSLHTWGRENCVAYITDGQTFDFKTNKSSVQHWYIPVEHWNLNYYPWIDNGFRTILAKERVLTNRGGRDTEHYIEALHGAFKDSTGDKTPRPDPFRPNQVFSPKRQSWIAISDAVWHEPIKDWVNKEDLEACVLCNVMALKTQMRTAEGHGRVCGAHKMLVVKSRYYLPDDVSRCEMCNYNYRLKEDKCCSSCLKNCKTCKNCAEDTVKYYTVYRGTYICYNCATTTMSNIQYHSQCGYYVLDEYCKRCKVEVKKPVPKKPAAKPVTKPVAKPTLKTKVKTMSVDMQTTGDTDEIDLAPNYLVITEGGAATVRRPGRLRFVDAITDNN